MAYDKKKAFKAMNLLSEIDPQLGGVFNEHTQEEKQALYDEYESILASWKIHKLTELNKQIDVILSKT